MKERFCKNCRFSNLEYCLQGFGTGKGGTYYICRLIKGRTVFENGCCARYWAREALNEQ